MKLRLATFLLLAGLGSAAPAADAPNAPISPNTPALLQQQLDAAIQSGRKKIVIPPGIYRLSGPDQKQRAWHLQFKDLKDIEIDATGAVFILTNPLHYGILFSNCHNVTFRGARLQRDPLPFSQGTIAAIDPEGLFLDVRIDPGYPDQLENRTIFPTFWSSLYNDKREWQGYVRAKTPPEIRKLEKGLFRVQLYDTVPSLKFPIAAGMKLAWRGEVKDDIRPMNCGDMKFIDITIAGGHGMAFHEMGGAGGNVYQRCKVTYPPKPQGATDESLQSTSADGLHSHDMERGPLVEDCLFEGIADDAIAIHGTYGLVEKGVEKQVVVRVFHETRDALFCRPGDTLNFYNEQGLPAGQVTVAAVKPLPGYKGTFKPNAVYRYLQEPEKDHYVEVLLTGNIPVHTGALVCNANRNGGGYIIRNTVMRNSISRGVMAKGAGGLIERCTFENLPRAGVEFMTEMEVWSEADYATDVTVRNNVFRRVSFNRSDGYLRHPGALTIFNYRANTEDSDLSRRVGHYVKAPGGHRNILIEDNRFEEIDGPNLLVTSAQGISILHNQFINPMRQDKDLGISKGVDTQALVWLSECEDIRFDGNTVRGAGPFRKKNVSAAVSAKNISMDLGFRDLAPELPIKNKP